MMHMPSCDSCTKDLLVPFCHYEHRRAVLPMDTNGRLLIWAAVLTNRSSAGGPMWARWPLASMCQKGLLWAAFLTNRHSAGERADMGGAGALATCPQQGPTCPSSCFNTHPQLPPPPSPPPPPFPRMIWAQPVYTRRNTGLWNVL